jgi:hypothetical protein
MTKLEKQAQQVRKSMRLNDALDEYLRRAARLARRLDWDGHRFQDKCAEHFDTAGEKPCW